MPLILFAFLFKVYVDNPRYSFARTWRKDWYDFDIFYALEGICCSTLLLLSPATLDGSRLLKFLRRFSAEGYIPLCIDFNCGGHFEYVHRTAA
jgi:hypothetical protein